MTRADHLGHVGHLLPAMHLDRKIAGTLADHDEMSCGDHYFALGNYQSVDCATVDDACNPIAEIASNDGIYDESLQAGDVREKRLGIERFHLNFPLHEAGNNPDACSARVPPKYFRPNPGFRTAAIQHPLTGWGSATP